MKDHLELGDYEMKPENAYKIKIIIIEKIEKKLKIGIDFTFNKINSVRKVNWDESAPWF